MTIEEVLERFSLLAGLTSAEAANWRTLCEDAVIQVRSRCRAEAETAEQSSLLCAAASALVYYWYALRCDAVESGSFSAGEMKVVGGNRAAPAKALLEEAYRQAAGLLWSDTFYFGVVPNRGGTADETK